MALRISSGWGKLLYWIQKYFCPKASPEILRARQLIAGIDQGGVPTNPILVNRIARSLGLEVSVSAPMQDTIERIRQALAV